MKEYELNVPNRSSDHAKMEVVNIDIHANVGQMPASAE